jgi:hypothetical protein
MALIPGGLGAAGGRDRRRGAAGPRPARVREVGGPGGGGGAPKPWVRLATARRRRGRRRLVVGLVTLELGLGGVRGGLTDEGHEQGLVVAAGLHQGELDARAAGEGLGEVLDRDAHLLAEAGDGPVRAGLAGRDVVAVAVVGGDRLAALGDQETLARVLAGAGVVHEALARDDLADDQREVEVLAPELGRVVADDGAIDLREGEGEARVAGDLDGGVEDVADLADQHLGEGCRKDGRSEHVEREQDPAVARGCRGHGVHG